MAVRLCQEEFLLFTGYILARIITPPPHQNGAYRDFRGSNFGLMEMGIQIRGFAEPPDHGHRPSLPVADAQAPPAQSLPGEEGLCEGGEHGGEKRGVGGEKEAQGEWEGQDPLAVGGLRQDAVHQVRGDVGGSARPTKVGTGAPCMRTPQAGRGHTWGSGHGPSGVRGPPIRGSGETRARRPCAGGGGRKAACKGVRPRSLLDP